MPAYCPKCSQRYNSHPSEEDLLKWRPTCYKCLTPLVLVTPADILLREAKDDQAMSNVSSNKRM